MSERERKGFEIFDSLALTGLGTERVYSKYLRISVSRV